MKYTLNVKDFLKGLLIAVGTAILVIVQNTISLGTLTFDWKAIGMAAIGAAITYLAKNFLTDGVAVAKTTLTDAAASTEDKEKVAEIQTNK
jgi:hypothetical protein